MNFERFPEDARGWVHRLLTTRRDVRHFDATRPIANDVLRGLLEAAHAAPSVGLSQPWRFVVVRDRARRTRIRESFLACRAREAERYTGARRERYLSLKLEGLLDAPLNLCVLADMRPPEEATLGTLVQPETLRASVVCAVQNFWLAARAEGIGVGWVSIVSPEVVRRELRVPAGVELVAYLCVGYPSRHYARPMLEEEGWKRARSLDALVHDEVYGEPTDAAFDVI